MGRSNRYGFPTCKTLILPPHHCHPMRRSLPMLHKPAEFVPSMCFVNLRRHNARHRTAFLGPTGLPPFTAVCARLICCRDSLKPMPLLLPGNDFVLSIWFPNSPPTLLTNPLPQRLA